jgi:phage shock protein E
MPNSPFDVAFDEGWEAMLETATLVDVRSAGEIREEGAIEDTLHIPMSADWVTEATSQLPDKNAPVLVFCAVGGRSSRAAEALRGAGYTNVKNAGGFLSIGDTRSGVRYV